MNLDIKDIIQVFSNSNLTKLKIEEGNLKIELEKQELEYELTPIIDARASHKKEALPVIDEIQEEYFQVTSPLVGIFYPKSDPDSDPYVAIGDSVEVGETLCMVEAMKMFNEIKSPVKGIVKKILSKEGDLVEFDQILFEIEEE